MSNNSSLGELENQVVVNSILPSTKEQKPSRQVFSSQIQNTTRKYDQPPQARIEEQKELLEEYPNIMRVRRSKKHP